MVRGTSFAPPVRFPITLELKFVVGAWATAMARREVTTRVIIDNMLTGMGTDEVGCLMKGECTRRRDDGDQKEYC